MVLFVVALQPMATLLLSLDDDVLAAILHSTSTPQELARFGKTCARFAPLVRRLLRDRSNHGVRRRFCMCLCTSVEEPFSILPLDDMVSTVEARALQVYASSPTMLPIRALR